MIIAIDGPAASGKGTLARLLAKHYGLKHLDTGGFCQQLDSVGPYFPTSACRAVRLGEHCGWLERRINQAL